MTIIVSGANGFLGSLLVNKLYNENIDVISIVHPNNISNLNEISKKSKKVIFSDFSNLNFCNDLPEEADAFVHFAWAGVNGKDKGNSEIQNQNVIFAKNAYLASNKRKIHKFIGIGTVTEFAFLNSSEVSCSSYIYGKYKYKCFESLRELSKNNKTEFLWARLSNLFGPTNNTGNILSYEINEILNNRIPEFGPADQYYDFLYVDDAITCIYKLCLLTTFNNIKEVNICSKKPRLLKEYLNLVSSCLTNKEAILIGAKPFDGLVFKKSYYSLKNLNSLIGDYEPKKFKDAINETIRFIKSRN